MKILKLRMNGLAINKNEKIEIDFTPEKKVMLETDEEVFELSKHIQAFNVMALYGMNATGKTSTLKLVEFAHKLYIEQLSIKELRSTIVGLTKNIEIECCIFEEDSIYNIKTKIDGDTITDETVLAIDKRVLSSKKILNNIALVTELTVLENLIDLSFLKNKVNTESFKEFIVELRKDEKSVKAADILSNDLLEKKSLFSFSIITGEGKAQRVISTISKTNLNLYALPTLSEFPIIVKDIAKLLDDNIEDFAYINNELEDAADEKEVKIKFYNEESFNIKLKYMEDYLSAGTIRGLNLFQDAFYALMSGGVFIVDEIDLNINLAIVEQLILLFKNKEINKHNALLIFTTHVPTLIDLLDRDDNIYILKKNKNKLSLKKLSTYKLRYDKVKSNSLISGEIGTNPNYESYNTLMKEVLRHV